MARLTAPRRRCCPTLAPRLGYGPSSTSAALWPLRHRLRLRSHLLLDVVVWEVRKRGVTVKDMTGVQLFVFQGVHTKTNDNGGTRNSSARKTTKQHTCGYLRARRLENVMDTGGRLNCVAHAYKHIFIVGVLRHL
uniref:Uncharacterized protein n=1 Tax=Oryza glumipatula TaxID=40148 RepID=A0A0D9YPN3_9ORYZ